MQTRIRFCWLGWLGLFLLSIHVVPRAAAEVELVAQAAIPGATPDETVDRQDRLGGFSGIAYTGAGDRYVLISDRGPGDGASAYRCRLHTMQLVLDAKRKSLATRLVSTTMLQAESGEPLVGTLAELGRSRSGSPLRFDPEAICLGRQGNYFISDEYGPCVYEFDPRGRLLRSLKLPESVLAENLSADPKQEQATILRGRLPNAGLEGLAISPDGTRLLGLLQGPLAQDGGRAGRHVRLLEVGLDSLSARQFVYVLDAPKRGLSELLAIDDHRFLVIERDGKPGHESKAKRIYKIDIRGASDVSAQASLPAADLPPGVTPVTKTLLLDLLDPRFGLSLPEIPAKVEGLCFGPDLPDGRKLLLVVSDNDFQPDQPSRIYAFALGPRALK